MTTPRETDWQSMGLAHYQPHQNAFNALRPRGDGVVTVMHKVPQKRGPKPQNHTAKTLFALRDVVAKENEVVPA